MNILVGCEESQRVCLAFREKGHNAFSCDIQDCSGNHPQYHIKGNLLDLLCTDVTFTTVDGTSHFVSKWDMLIAFPPCTYFSRVNFLNYFKKTGFNKQRFDKALEMVAFFNTLYNSDIEKICLENPVPLFLFNDLLPPYSMILQPYEFGEPYTKKTCLWLKGLPYLMPTLYCPYTVPFVDLKDSRSLKKKSKERSKTFYGVASAMASQWG